MTDKTLKLFMNIYDECTSDIIDMIDTIAIRYNTIVEKYKINGNYLIPLMPDATTILNIFGDIIHYEGSDGTGYTTTGDTPINWLFSDNWEIELGTELKEKYDLTIKENKIKADKSRKKHNNKKYEQYLKLKKETD